ncbi:MAG: cell division protein FtsQ/DivIB [Balneolales bacterium]|nr:cell division protein FtsQ/DivIB [Balneolales bacterium]
MNIYNRPNRDASSPHSSMGKRIDADPKATAGKKTKSGISQIQFSGFFSKLKNLFKGGVSKYAIILILLVSSLVALSYFLKGNVAISSVEVQGVFFTPVADVIEASGIFAGIPADSVHALRAMENVEKLPYVSRAELLLSTFGSATIKVKERRPAAILVQGDALAMVDLHGIKMKLPAGYMPDVPLLYGFNVHPLADTLKSEAFGQIADFLTELNKSPLGSVTISELGWHAEDGVFALSREQAVRLVFGKEDYTDRIRKWEAFYQQIIPAKGIREFTRIDLRFHNQIVTR